MRHLCFFYPPDVRIAALEALVEITKADCRPEDLEFLLDLIENDPEPRVRHELLLMMAKTPPFERGRGNRLDTVAVMDRCWKLMKYSPFPFSLHPKMIKLNFYFSGLVVADSLTTPCCGTTWWICTIASMDGGNHLAYREQFISEWPKLLQQLWRAPKSPEWSITYVKCLLSK